MSILVFQLPIILADGRVYWLHDTAYIMKEWELKAVGRVMIKILVIIESVDAIPAKGQLVQLNCVPTDGRASMLFPNSSNGP
jgi:hypothetical protein